MKEVTLTRGYVALVDDADYEHVTAHKWTANPQSHTIYARRNVKGHTQMLHRFIMEAQPGQIVDHINGNGLDCQRSNLRFATHALNNANSRSWSKLGFRGIAKKKKRFAAKIKHQGVVHLLGSFKSPIKAALAYDDAARHFYGSFAHLNFPDVRGAAVL